ncbi:alpha-protein kinase 2 [Enhydra lutris kenyoni]|uniref:Alpha-protein kinase 2 n=1 Tax=Enhydra lutris kenyoni TaxID=391180 RepID=A0A2Y9KJK4_ENHLU|nr:alpha-protein kinase 2 [Enhydra lutris kenyoni]
MTDSGEPQRHTLCFLSTLLSQKVPEKSDAVLRCIVSGQPKPEVTWYKNGRAIKKCGIVSSYEFFQNQYIHALHLYRCSPDDAAVYQISAKNSSGMICCSASVEVKCSAENPQLSPDPKDGRGMGWRHATEACAQEKTDQLDEKEHPREGEENVSTGTAMSADSPSSKFSCSCSLQASSDPHASSLENPLDVKGTRPTGEARDLGDAEEAADGLLFSNLSRIPTNHNVYCHRTVHSKGSRLTDALHSDDPQDRVSDSGQADPTGQKYVSFSLPLSEGTASVCPGDRAAIKQQVSPQVSSEDSDSDYELCPEITLTCTEEFSDDDLEYLECSDVMTDYSNAVWQRKLQGTEHVFLLESDDEEMESSACCLGGCEHLLGEMGCGSRVSDDIGPMEATTGLCGYHSQPPEVGVRSGQASTHSPSSLQTGMILTLGPHWDATSAVTDPGRYKPPAASEATENDYPGIRRETRDSHQAGEEFTSDHLLNTDKAEIETAMQRLSGELEKPGASQWLEIAAEGRVGDEGSLTKRGSEKPARLRWPSTRGKPKKLSPSLKANTTESTFNLFYPKEPVKHPRTQSDQRDGSWARAEADCNSQFPAGQCASPVQAEREGKTPQTPRGSLPQGGYSGFAGEGMPVQNLFETGGVPDWSARPRVQIQETVRERDFLSQLPAFSDPAGEQSAFAGTTTNSFPNAGGIDEEDRSLARYLELGSCTQCPQHGEKQDRKDHVLGGSWTELGYELSIPDAHNENTSPWELSVLLPQEGSADPWEPKALSVASPEPEKPSLTLETPCNEPGGREAASVLECLEARDQGTRDTMDSPAGASADRYLPPETCYTDLEPAEIQSKVSDSRSRDNETPGILSHTQRSELPQCPCRSSKGGDSAAPPLFTSTFTWNISQKASKGGTGENLAETENVTSALVSTVQPGRERPSPGSSGGFEERQPLCSENSSSVQFPEGGDESPRTRAPDTADTPAGNGSVVMFPPEKPVSLTTNLECLRVTRESGDTSTVTMATKVHPAKYLPVSIAEDSHANGPRESSPQAPEGNICQLPSNAQLGHIFHYSTTASLEEPFGLAPGGPGVHIHVPQLPEGEGFCHTSPLQTDNHSGNKSPAVDGAGRRSLEEHFQDKESETTQRIQQESLPQKSSPPEDDLQESWSRMPVAQGQIVPLSSHCLSANSREERGLSSGAGTSACEAAEAAVEVGGQAPSHISPLSNVPLEESGGSRPGLWETGSKLKIITLEASIPEVWPPRQQPGSKYKELEAGPTIPDRVWAVWDVLKAHGPQAESGSELAIDREVHVSGKPAGRASWRSLSSEYLSQPRLLESSVDPVDEKELDVADLLYEPSKTGKRENVNSVSRNREGDRVQADRAAFFKRFLTRPKVMESPVDPTDAAGGTVCAWAETAGPPASSAPVISEDSDRNAGPMGQRLAVRPPVLQVLSPDKGWGARPRARGIGQIQEGSKRSSGEAERSKNDKAESVFPTLPLSDGPAVMTHACDGADIRDSSGQMHDVPEKGVVGPRNHPYAFSDSKDRGAVESECGKHSPSPSALTRLPFTACPEGNITNFSERHKIQEPIGEEPRTGEATSTGASGSPAVTLASTAGGRVSEKAPEILPSPCQQGSSLGSGRKPREEKLGHTTAQTLGFPKSPAAGSGSREVKRQEAAGRGPLAEGVKKKLLSRVATLRLRLEEENVRRSSSFLRRIPAPEPPASGTDGRQDAEEPPCRREGKAPILLKKIQAEMYPDHSGNIKLCCQFAEIHEDSTVWWTKDSKSIAQVQRSAGDNSIVSLAIMQAGQKDQGTYDCSIKNSYGKLTTEFNLTAEVLKQLTSHQDLKGCEEIEFSQLIFREDFLSDSYFGDHLRGQIATEELHFGEGVHRKAFRSKVMRGLTPVFQPGHACVLKVHNAVAYGTRNNDELIQRNYKLAAQECYVQNTARHYAQIYAAEAQPLEGFGEVPEIIPIFLIHRPDNNIPYATVEEELIGEFVKYSIRDGKEINFLRRDSEAGQKCCTFQHWVYQKTSGCLLVTDMQGVGMKLTDVGIATLAKGYKGFKGNCSMTFIDQFKALHQCNKYCKMLGLKSLQNNSQKQKKPSVSRSKTQPNSIPVRKVAPGTPAEKKTSRPL